MIQQRVETFIQGRDPRHKPELIIKNTKSGLKFSKKHIDAAQALWESILWTDEINEKLFIISH